MFRILVLILMAISSAGAYRNPLTLPKEAEGPGIADPGLLRWMGKYYLYSTKTGEPGIRCWESADLVNWNFKGYCTGDEPVFANHMAWSPTPLYFNGMFYLYVCGVDQKHKVFEADKPWGPFKCVNPDFLDVNTLDAVPFLDDDGQLYVFYAGWAGNAVQWRTCSSPTKADGRNQRLPACQFSVNPGNWWTEGPSLFKRNGIYYLTYCGNNWQEDNYQIRAAKGRTIRAIRPQDDKPLIAQLTGPWVATGCNSMVLGPDLKSLWNVYHCRKQGSWERRLCLDRLYIDPATKDLWTEAPTWNEQRDPSLPDWQEDWSDSALTDEWVHIGGRYNIVKGEGVILSSGGKYGAIASACETGPSFVAEFNIRVLDTEGDASTHACGVWLCDDNQGCLLVQIDVSARALIISSTNPIKAASPSTFLPKWLNPFVWHVLRIEKEGSRVQVYLDDMRKFDAQVAHGGGKFGLMTEGCKAEFGWCGFSNLVGSGIEKPKPARDST